MKTRVMRGNMLFYCLMIILFIFLFFASLSLIYAGAAETLVAGKISPDASRLWSPGRLAVDSAGVIYAVDSYKGCVRMFDGKGNPLGLLKVSHPSAVAVASDGTVYIGSHQDYSVTIYKQGAPAGKLGSGSNEFLSIRDLAVDEQSGEVYVADAVGNAVKVYDAAGATTRILSGLNAPAAVAVTDAAVYVLDAPTARTANGAGASTGSRISILDRNGTFVRWILESHSETGQMIRPTDLSVDTFGNVYVSDASRKAVLVYDRTGAFVGTMTSPAGDLNTAVSVSLFRDRLYVASSETRSLVEIGLGGTVSSDLKYSLEFTSKSGDRIAPGALGY